MSNQEKPGKKEQMIWILSDLSNTNAGVFDETTDQSVLLSRAAQLSSFISGDSEVAKFLTVNDTKAEIVWGPAMTNSAETYERKVGDEMVKVSGNVTDNLMYVVKCINPEGNKPMYVVAVSGTNPVSSLGWFDEDFDVSSTVAWPPVYIGSKTPVNADNLIAKGSSDGLQKLWSLKDPNTKQPLIDYIRETLNGTDSVEITTCGHSLGGALSPLVAMALAENRTASNQNEVTISTYPTAGPTTGNDDFAKYVITKLGAENYVSRINSLDIVPHAWAQSDMNQLSSLYNHGDFWNLKVYFTTQGIVPSPLNEGLVRWAEGQRQAGVDFTRIAGDIPFSGDIVKHNWLVLREEAKLLFDNNDDVKTAMQDIECYMTGSVPEDKVIINNLTQLLAYAKEAGVQHTSAYPIDCYQYDQKIIDELNQYVELSDLSKDGKGEAIYIVTLLITKVVTYLKQNPLKDCKR